MVYGGRCGFCASGNFVLLVGCVTTCRRLCLAWMERRE